MQYPSPNSSLQSEFRLWNKDVVLMLATCVWEEEEGGGGKVVAHDQPP